MRSEADSVVASTTPANTIAPANVAAPDHVGIGYHSRERTRPAGNLRSRSAGNFRLCLGRVKVTTRITGYERRRVRGQEIAVAVDENEARYVELQPGEISLHHVRAVHGSAPNRSSDRRIGVAVRYIAPHVRQVNGGQDSAWLVRGEDRHRNFIHETPPVRDMDPAARAEHARIMTLRQEVLYKGVAGKPGRELG